MKAVFFACEGNLENDGYLYLLSYNGWYQDSIDFEYDLYARDFSVYFPKINNERIMLQEGCFTVFPLPTNTEKIQDLKRFTNKKGTGELFEIKIPSSNKKKLLWELNELGINHKNIYPGIEGICKNICHDLNY